MEKKYVVKKVDFSDGVEMMQNILNGAAERNYHVVDVSVHDNAMWFVLERDLDSHNEQESNKRFGI